MTQADPLMCPPGGGDDMWSSGWLPHPTPSSLSRVEMALLLIRVGPIVGLVVSFGVGWLQRLCGLTLAWVVWPLTGRPLQQLGSVCQSVWSGDMGAKYSGLLVYLYLLLLCLWWLMPHSAGAKVGLLSLTAMPCLSSSLYYALQGVAAASSRTLRVALTSVIHPLTGGTLKACKPMWRRCYSSSEQNCMQKAAQAPAVAVHSPLDAKHTRSVFHLSGESPADALESEGDASSNARSSEWRRTCLFLGVAKSLVVGTFSLLGFLLRGLFRAPFNQPLLEARGAEESNIYHGLEERYCQVLRMNNSKAALLTKLPWKSFSRLWGFLHNLYLPFFLRYVGLTFYAWLFDVNLQEAVEPRIGAYRNLSQFFRRHLRPGLRPVDPEHVLTSPADGRVLYLSQVQNGVLEQVKGVTYSIRGFLGPPSGLDSHLDSVLPPTSMDNVTDEAYVTGLVSRPENVLWQCIIYLGPGDYHHFHSPTDWSVSMRRHIPGELFSVNPGIARWLQGLFSFNERAIYTGRWEHGFFSFTAVGATNVGSIAVDFDKDLRTNQTTPYDRNSFFDCRFDTKDTEEVTVTKGQHIGEFHLGSTLVLIFEAPRDFEFAVEPGQKLRYGQPLGRISKENGCDS